MPGFVFVEIGEEGRTVQRPGAGEADIARVGRDVLAEALPVALTFELSKGL